MCGRFAFFSKNREILASLGAVGEPPSFESYNITPSQDILSILTSPETGQSEYTFLRWGLLPFWSKTFKTKFPMINARAEGIDKKPSFRGPFKYRRCIIPANGFYEWKRSTGGKLPYYIRPVNGCIFHFAGIWDHWEGEGMTIESCAIITTDANEGVAEIHDRMPVILEEEMVSAWLDPKTGPQELLAMVKPYPKEKMTAYPVSSLVNSPRHNGPECVERVRKQQELFTGQDLLYE